MKYRGGYKYQLAENEAFQTEFKSKIGFKTDFLSITKEGLLVVHKGYAWDGPSGPTYDDEAFIYGSLAHDALYQLMRGGWLPHSSWRSADKEMEKFIKIKLKEKNRFVRGIWKARMVWVMAGLKLAKGKAADPGQKKKVYEV